MENETRFLDWLICILPFFIPSRKIIVIFNSLFFPFTMTFEPTNLRSLSREFNFNYCSLLLTLPAIISTGFM